MIYGIIFGISLLLAAIAHGYELFPFYYALLGGIACMAIVTIAKMQRVEKAKPVPATVVNGTSTTPSSPPTPVPVATTKKNGWVWLIVGILVAIIAYHFIAPMMRTTAPTQQATAPKKELHKYKVRRPLEFLGGENLTRGLNYVEITKDVGYMNFRVNLPVVKNGQYKIYYHGRRAREGQDLLEINRGKGNSGMPFSIDHRATDFPVELVFFDDGYDIGMPGDAKYFRTGDNFIKLWANGDLRVQLDQPPYVEITYWE